ncbi:MAG: glycoside hydrolase family 10 protein [Bacteroidales bacterium]
MNRLLIALFFTLSLSLFAEQPKHEIRAAWVTTAWRLDWPTTLAKDSASVEKQRREFVKIVEHLHFLNFNTIFLQVRMRNDLIYPSAIEPWSAMLTGKSRKSPLYDPLAFASEECHKRGIECHAWMVTIPIGSDKQTKANGEASLLKTHPELCKRIKDEWFLDPGIPETANYLASIASEITKNYDIDGIHLDYLRYPEIGEFPDKTTHQTYGENQPLADWRRANINRIVATIYDSVKVLKPWVQLSSSPIGKSDDLDSISSHGWNGRSRVFQDVKQWLSEGKQDMIAPMLYFKEPIFKPFLRDWKMATGVRPVAAGIALYMMNDRKWSNEIVENEIAYTRQINCGGQTYFRTENLIKNTKNITDIIKQKYYLYPALLPPMVWIDSIAPDAPQFTKVYQVENKIIFEWENKSVKKNCTFNIYASNQAKIDTKNIQNLVACRVKGNQFEFEISDDFEGDMYFSITSNDRYHNESQPSNTALLKFPYQIRTLKLNLKQ